MPATWRKRGKKSWRVVVHWKGQRESTTVHSEADAKALVQFIHRQELGGINVIESLRAARAPALTYPILREALSQWLDGQVATGEIRLSSAKMYKSCLGTWVFPVLGDLPINRITREQLGECITRIRSAGKSMSTIQGCHKPLRRYYAWLVGTGTLGASPAADLRLFIGRAPHRKEAAFFGQEEGRVLMAACRTLFPGWEGFVLSGLLGGLRWGESAALFKSDIDFARGLIHVQRTLSAGKRLERPKDHEGRWVRMSAALAAALQRQVEAVALEGQVNNWSPEARQFVFPDATGGVVNYSNFLRRVWRPLLKKANLPYRRYHATRHSYSSWLLADGADLRFVQRQLGHSSVTLTSDRYGHLVPDGAAAVQALDRYVN